jgi:hypothetical protein
MVTAGKLLPTSVMAQRPHILERRGVALQTRSLFASLLTLSCDASQLNGRTDLQLFSAQFCVMRRQPHQRAPGTGETPAVADVGVNDMLSRATGDIIRTDSHLQIVSPEATAAQL